MKFVITHVPPGKEMKDINCVSIRQTMKELTVGQWAKCSLWEPVGRVGTPAPTKTPAPGGVGKILVKKSVS
jgi:hypothetical protein